MGVKLELEDLPWTSCFVWAFCAWLVLFVLFEERETAVWFSVLPYSTAPQSDPTLNLQNAIYSKGKFRALNSIRVRFLLLIYASGQEGEKEAGSPPYFPSLILQHPSEVCFIFGRFENNQLEFFLLRLSPEMTLYAYHQFSKLSKSTSEHRSGGWLLGPFRQSQFFISRLCGPSTPYAHTAGNGKTTPPSSQ
jgi:hypothetical protein